MDKKNTLIATLIILAILGFALFFLNQMRLSEKENILAEQANEFEKQQEILLLAQKEMQEQNAESARLAKQADEARRMAEAQAEKERLERQRLVDELNARLLAEAADRKAAEEAQLALAKKMKALEEAQLEAQAALAALEASSTVGALDETAGLKAKIEAQEQSLATLSQENQALKEKTQLLESRQIATEEAIVKAGGRIDLPYPEIRSPNVRRREAIYFKERILGHSPGG
jgi:hypothetical protein